MRYAKPFTYLFRQPRALATITTGALMLFLPIVGQIAIHGWLVTVHRALLEGREEVPPLSFSDFSRHLQVGIGPWLVTLVLGLVFAGAFTPIYTFLSFGVGIAMPIVAGLGAGETVVLGVMTGFMVLIFGVMAALGYLALAATNLALARAELASDVSTSFTGIGPGALFAMARLLKKELFWSTVSMAFGGAICGFLGLLALYFGIFPAIFVVLAAGAHYRHQLYGLYLARGGKPVPIHPLPGSPPSPPAAPGAPVPYGG